MENLFLWILAGIVVILLIVITRQILQSIEVRTLADHERLAIYRLGRFHRIRGPGVVTFTKGLDTKTIPFNVLEQPMKLFAPSIFVNGFPIGLTVDFWYTFDPEQAIGPNKEQLNRLFQMRETDRREQISLRLKERLSEQLGIITRREAVPRDAELVEKLMPILPGSPLRNELLQSVQPGFSAAIRNLGLLLSVDNPMIISQLHLPEGMGEMLNRGRLVEQLRGQFPNLPDDDLAQIIASIEHREAPNIHKYVVDGAGEAQIGTRRRQDNTEEERFSFRTTADQERTRPEPVRQEAPEPAVQSPVTSPPPVQQPPPVNAEAPKASQPNYSLSNADLDILKSVPKISKLHPAG